jgi:CheY-like chemotaxis protein
MPKLNGDEATAKLRAAGVQAPVVGLTGDAHAEEMEQFRAMGANEVSAVAASHPAPMQHSACRR